LEPSDCRVAAKDNRSLHAVRPADY